MADTSGKQVLKVGGLNKRYKNGTWANRDITFAVGEGELLGILGPNGAGKTTLVRQITTELLPTSGEVRVMGYSAVSDPMRVKGVVGTIPQEATLYGELSVWHHLRAFGRFHGLSRKGLSRSRGRAGRGAPARQLSEQVPRRAVRGPPPEGFWSASPFLPARRFWCWTSRPPDSIRNRGASYGPW